jgi:hypothetical protein
MSRQDSDKLTFAHLCVSGGGCTGLEKKPVDVRRMGGQRFPGSNLITPCSAKVSPATAKQPRDACNLFQQARPSSFLISSIMNKIRSRALIEISVPLNEVNAIRIYLYLLIQIKMPKKSPRHLRIPGDFPSSDSDVLLLIFSTFRWRR